MSRVTCVVITFGACRLGQPYWRSPQAYLHHSPLFLVERILAPVMIIASDADGSLPEAQTLFAALVRIGRETVLVRYWGESHAISSPANQCDEVQRIETWLNAHLSDPG